MYLAQTTLKVDTSKIYELDGQEVYLTLPKLGTKAKIVVKSGYDTLGRDTNIYNIDYIRKRKLKLKYEG